MRAISMGRTKNEIWPIFMRRSKYYIFKREKSDIGKESYFSICKLVTKEFSSIKRLNFGIIKIKTVLTD